MVKGLLGLVLAKLVAMKVNAVQQCQNNRIRRLPSSRLIIAYATDRSLRENKIVPACCEHGVNLVIWSFTHLELDSSENGRIVPTFDLKKAQETIQRIRKEKKDVIHLTSIGGWNGPHPSPSLDGQSWFAIWQNWNKGIFDGVDWDLEGHDDTTAITTILEQSVLNLVVDFTKSAQSSGFLVGAAPAESYLDASSSLYSSRLNHQPLAPWDFSFPYAGRNAYAPLLADLQFDFITIQLYEGYSRACFALTKQNVHPVKYLTELVLALKNGFHVQLNDNDNTGESRRIKVKVQPDRLVLGFANDWADGTKFVRFDPRDIGQAFKELLQQGAEPRGVAFWVLDEEGEHDDHYFAKDISLAFSSSSQDNFDDTVDR